MKALTILALFAVVAIELVVSTPEVKTCKPGSYKIPHVLAPSMYVMRIQPNLNDMTYKGLVSISLKKTDGRSPRAKGYTAQALLSKMGMSQWESIAINVDRKFVELDLGNIYYRTYGNVDVDIKSVCYDDANSVALLTLEKSIFDPSVSGGWINVGFSGKIPAANAVQQDGNKVIKVFDSSLRASQKFPCIEDPQSSTNFKLHLEIPENQSAVSSIGEAVRDYRDPEFTKFTAAQPIPLEPFELSIIVPQ